MKKLSIITKLSLFVCLLFAGSFTLRAQEPVDNVLPNYVFTADSLKGFDEDAAMQYVFNEGYFGEEFKVMMYYLKRDYVKAKYNLKSLPPAPERLIYKQVNPTSKIAVANCVNEDFEEGSLTSAVPGTITIAAPTTVNGWTVNSGLNQGTNASCVYKTITGNPNAAWIMGSGATGLIDPVIGASYPIYSVFGNAATTYPNATTVNGFQCFGNWFAKLNNNTGGYTVHRMKKDINVTPANAVFQFAFIAVLQSSHCCCTSGGFSIKVKVGCAPATPTLLGCPQFTATAPQGAGCPGGAMACGTPTTGNVVTYLPAAQAGVSYNKWKLNTIDLTPYLGQCVSIEVEAFDCNASGHYGYVYFDSQCSPMAIIGNGTSFPAGTPQITLPTCGTGNTATITAPNGLAPYLWAGPDPLVNGSTAQTVTTSVTGNYTLTMNPPGSCQPIVRTVSVVISPAPNMAVTSQTQVSCTSTVNGVSLQFASGTPNTASTPNYTVIFAPTAPTGTTSTTANTGVYTGLATGVNTITIVDMVGCTATTTVNMNGAPPIGSFSISAPSGTLVGCTPPSINLQAINTSTLSNMTFTWSSITTGTQTGANWTGGAPSGTNVLTVTGIDLTVGSCPVTQTIAIAQNTAVPGVTVTPITRTITCNGACATFTAITTTTTNITGQWFDAGAVPQGGPSGTPVLLCAGNPGIYTVVFTNAVNGCTASQTVAVVSNSAVPSMSVNSPNGYTITCAQPTLGMNIQASPGPAPKTYSWTNVTTSVTTSPVNGGYTVTTPGQYVAQYKDGNACQVSQTITVMIDTVRTFPNAITSLPSNSYTLNCMHPTLTATAISNPLLATTNYSWVTPPNLTVSSNTIVVVLSNITSSTTPTNYTVLVQNPINGCVGRQRVSFYKDIFVPPYTAVFTPSAITCGNPCVALSPGSSTSTVPVTFTFTSPAPTFTATNSGALFCNPGTYTMTYQSTLNGCTGITTTVIPLNVTPPATVNLAPVSIPCGQTTTVITAGTTTTSTTYSYTWDGPLGAGMSCPSCYSTSVNTPGVYDVFILNTINGCSATNSILVTSGGLAASFSPNPASGYAPLNVNFANTSPFTSNSGTVTTVWSYGNGSTVGTTSLANTYSASGFPSGSTTYNSAGTYTVLLMITQNSGTATCVGTASAVVNVELPSNLTVPNVFSPNGDGVNDNFTLLTTNLTDITCTIFDRWGAKMYDVKSEKGNISWDGKNFGGKEVPVGTYFYILKAKGKDGQEYEQNGTISLYR